MNHLRHGLWLFKTLRWLIKLKSQTSDLNKRDKKIAIVTDSYFFGWRFTSQHYWPVNLG
jgi:hypothetical protein